MQTMTKSFENETWMDIAEAASYIGRSRQGFRDALARYEQRTGKEIEKLPEGNKVYVKQSDINDLIRALFPLQARQKGLV